MRVSGSSGTRFCALALALSVGGCGGGSTGPGTDEVRTVLVSATVVSFEEPTYLDQLVLQYWTEGTGGEDKLVTRSVDVEADALPVELTETFTVPAAGTVFLNAMVDDLSEPCTEFPVTSYDPCVNNRSEVSARISVDGVVRAQTADVGAVFIETPLR